MAQKKFMYPAEWVKQKPYKVVDSVDIYYTGIANKIRAILKETRLDTLFADEQNLKVAVMSIAGWFEDVISQNGIWQAFTTECERRYGARLPFFSIGADYYPDEINKEDIQYLLWHNLQVVHRLERIIYPLSPVIDITADMIYDMLNEEYETAPENERLHEFIYGHEGYVTNYDHYVSVALWLHYQSFFNVENYDEFIAVRNRSLENVNPADVEKQTLAMGFYVTLMLNGTHSPLALTTPQWMAHIADGHKHLAEWKKVEVRKASCYLVESIADDGNVTLKDLCAKGKVKISAEDLGLGIPTVQVGRTTVICEFLKFGNAYTRIGSIAENVLDENVQRYIDTEKAKRDKSEQKRIYDEFVSATGGKYVKFFTSKEEAEHFLTDNLGYAFAEGVKLPDMETQHGVMLMVSPETGLTFQPGFMECLKCDDNPAYDKAKAEKNSLPVIARANAIPYDVMCRMQDDGMWADATVPGCEDPEEGRRMAQGNLQFLTDYYYRKYRDMATA